MKWKHVACDSLIIAFGTAMYAFGLVYFNMANQLAEGGVTGITLILLNLFHIDPSISTLVINIPLIFLGGKMLGKRSLIYTILGTLFLSFFLFMWQKIPFVINIDHDLFIASLLAGFFGGVGSGLVYRSGGTTGGADIVARILEKKVGLSMGKSLLAFDGIVLLFSLTYIDLKHMTYTLIVSYVFSQIIDFVQYSSYKARGVFIISQYNEQIATCIMETLERGVSFFHGHGGYLKQEKDILYVVVSSSELIHIKRIVENLDPQAFISIINVHEVVGEGFTYHKKPTHFLLK